MYPKCSLIIEEKHLFIMKKILKTLKSLRYVDYSEFEIVVIDDGSTDQTLEVLKERRLKSDKKDSPCL